MQFETIVGIFGAALILVGFVMNQFGKWPKESIQYDGINLFGGGLLLWYSLLIGSAPFAILNLVWTAVALRDVVRTIFKR